MSKIASEAESIAYCNTFKLQMEFNVVQQLLLLTRQKKTPPQGRRGSVAAPTTIEGAAFSRPTQTEGA
jgi:hypothetical protein